MLNPARLSSPTGETSTCGTDVEVSDHICDCECPKAKFDDVEDRQLLGLVGLYGAENWSAVAHGMTGRTAKQCRDRYVNYIDPILKHGKWTEQEDALLIRLYTEIGGKWGIISRTFKNRSTVALRNRLYTIRRRDARVDGIVGVTKETQGKKEKLDFSAVIEELVAPAADDNFSERRFYNETGYLTRKLTDML